MSKNFGYIENKVLEAEFHLKNFKSSYKMNKIFESQCYFNAFLSAARSITMVLQFVMKDIEDFNEWYKKQTTWLKESDTLRYFVDFRNDSIHQGKNFVISADWNVNSESGERELETFFKTESLQIFRSKISKDILNASGEYFTTLLRIIQQCYVKYGAIIDPDQYWTIENIENKKLTCEDIEESMGFPRGWTEIDGYTEKERKEFLIQSIRSREATACPLEPLFYNYLGVNKMGERIKKKT